jgi:hypothetical protein
MDFMARTTNRPGLTREYIETTGAVPGRSARGRALKLVNRVTSAVFDDDYSFSFA